MKTLKFIGFTILLIFLSFISFYIGRNIVIISTLLSNRSIYQDTPNFKIGDTLLHSFEFNDEDPFTEIKSDTVTVLDIKGSYVKYRFINLKFNSSCKIWILNKTTRKIMSKHTINATINVINGKVCAVNIIKVDESSQVTLNTHGGLLILQSLINEAVNNFERENQKSFIPDENTIYKLPKYE